MKSLYSFLFRLESASNVKLSESLSTNPTKNSLKKFILRTAGVVALFLFLGGSMKGQTVQTFSTSGTYTWVCPTGVTSVTVQAWGGGGAGGGVNTTGVNRAGGGGGGGAFATSTVTVVPGTSYTVVVGAGGTGVSAANGNNGAASTFNTNFVIAAGGNGGLGHTGATATAMSGGLGGAAASCTPSLGAFSGGLGGTSATTPTSGGGGGGAGSTAAGGAASGGTAGTGGSTGGGAGAAGVTTGNVVGTAGNSPGGGGSGARAASSSTTARAGGAGGAGQVIISYNCPVNTIPFNLGFEPGQAGAPFTDQGTIGNCLSQASVSGTGTWLSNNLQTTYNRTPRSGSWNATLAWSNERWFFIPVSLTVGNVYNFSMYARQDGSTTTDANIVVSYGASATAAAMTNSIVTSTGLTATYAQLSNNFTPSSSGTFYIGIKGYMNGTPFYISIDDISITSLPACTAPTSLSASVTSSTQTNTTISGAFTAATTAPSGYVVVRTTTNTQPTLTNGTTYTVGVSGSNYIEYAGASAGSWSSTGLTAGNTYYYWVFSYNNTSCSGGPAYSATAATLTQATSSCSGASLANLSYTLASPTYCSGVAISTNTATLGTTNGTVTYTVSPALPTGLTLNTSTGAITGTPSATSAATAYTVTANNGCTTTTASLSITVVTALSGLTYTSAAPTAYCVGTAISSNLVTAITGGGTITYSVSPALPSGLTLNTATGEITGTPTTSAASATYTVTATNGSCSTTRALTIAVNNNLASSTLAYTTQSVAYCRNAAITSNTATLTPSLNNGTVTFSVSPALPTGLTLSPTTGAITGTPTATQATTSYTVTATSACGGSTTSTVVITINTPGSVTAPAAATICSGGVGTSLTASGISNYTWSPTTGLSASNVATVTANPTTTTTYTISGTDANGCTAATGTVTVTVNQTPATINIAQTPASVCSESVATLTASGGTISGAAIIGTATTVESTSTSHGAFNGYRSSQMRQTIFTAAELSAAGLVAGNITALAYNINSQGSSTSNNITIKIGTTSNSAFATNAFYSTTSYTTVFGPSSYTHSASGWQTITFTTPFTWNGTSNIVIDVWQDGPNGSADPGTYYTATSDFKELYYWNSAAGSSPAGTVSSLNRFNVTFTGAKSGSVAWSPTTNLYTNAGATTAYTGVSATTVYAVNTSSTQYTATATNGSCSTSTSITTSVNPLPTITLGTASAVCAGGTTSSLSYTATTGNPDQYIIDFDATANAAGFVDITSYTAFSASPITLNVPSGAAAGTYNGTIIVKNSTTGCIGSATSFTLTVNAPVSITAQPNNSVSLEGSDATFSVTATGTGLTYQWQVSTDSGSSWNNASGTSTNSSYTAASITASMAGYQYRCVVSGTAPCGAVTSNAATLTISTTAITSQPASATICSNGSNTFTISTSGSTPTYQWQVSTDAGVSYTDISGETTSSLTVSGLTATNSGNRYRCVLSGSIYSDAAVLTVYNAVAIGTQPTSQIVCSNAASTSFSVSATGSNLTYQWQVSTNGGSTWSNASGTSTNSTYTISSITNALNLNQYRVIVSGSSPCAAITSDAATLNVIGVSLAVSSASICMNGSFTLTATPTSGSPTLSYSWICATSGSGATTANTSNPATITPTAVGSYTYTLTTTGGGCTLTSTTAVTVNANPSITSATASPGTVCAGSNVSLSAASISSSAGSASIGLGASTSSSVGSSMFPGSWGGAKTQYLIRASDLQSAGLVAGNINSVSFEATTSGQAYPGFALSIGTTTLTTMPSSFQTGLTQLYSTASFTPTVGVNTLNFTSPFAWDGTSNVIISFCWSTALTTSTSSTVKTDAASYTCTYGWNVDSQSASAVCGTSGAASGGNTAVNGTTRPKFIFGGQVGTVQTANFNWYWNTTPAVTTATGTTVAANNTSSPTTQAYTVTATNPTTGCASASTTSVITINPTPATPAANSTSICGTQNATCSVTGSGIVGNTFKWYTVPTGGTPIVGQSGFSLTAYSVSTTTIFYVSESNATCESGRVAVTQTVTTSPSVSASATSATICAGQSTSLSVSSSNSGYSYSWSNSAGSGTSVSISPTSTTTYTVSATDVSGGASNGCSSTATVTVTVNPVPTSVTATAGSGTICNGSSVDLSSTSLSNSSNQVLLSSTGDGGFENGSTFATNNWSTAGTGNNLWYVGTAAVNAGSRAAYISTNSSLGVAATYNKTTSRVSHLYRDVTFPTGATNITLSFNWQGVGESTYDYTAVYLVPTSTTPTAAVALTAGQIGSNLNGQSTWQSASFALSNNVAGTTQRLVFSWINDGSSGTDPSGVIDNVSITYSPASVYSWASSPVGFTSSTQNPTGVAPTQTTTYTVTATNNYSCSSSASATITVNPVSVAGTASSDQTICSGATPAALTLAGNTGTIQWQSSTTSSTAGFTNISGETNATLTLGALTTTTYYRAVVTSGVCASATSNVVTVTVNPTSVAGTVSANQAICAGSTPANITLTGNTGTIQWQSSSNNSSFANINGATNSTLTTAQMGTLTTTTYFRATVTSGVCSAVNSGVVIVALTAAPNAGTLAGSQIICGNSTTSFTTDGNSGGTWTSGTQSVATVNASTGVITPVSVGTSTITYTVTGTGGCSNATATRTITIGEIPTATASSNARCDAGSITLYGSASAGATTDWYADAIGGSPLAQTTGQFNTPTLTVTTTYFVEARNITTGCVSASRVPATGTINNSVTPSVVVTSSDADNIMCAGESVTFTATPTNGGTTPSYQWKLNNNNVSGTGSTYSSSALVNNDVVSVVMTSNNTCQTTTIATSNSITNSINTLPVPLTLTGSSFCASTSNGGTITSSGSASGVAYQLWLGNAEVSNSNLVGTGSTLVWSPIEANSGYYVIGTNLTTNCSSSNSNEVVVSQANTNSSYVYYADSDGDGFGSNTPTVGCSATTPSGYLTTTGDCNDALSNINPGALEVCNNMTDENCSGSTDDSPSFYRTVQDGNWNSASTWEVSCSNGLSYSASTDFPSASFAGIVNILNTHDVTIPNNGTVYQTGTLDIDNGGTLTMTGNGFINDPTTATVSAVAKLTVTLTIINDGILNIGHQASLVQTATTAGLTNTGSGAINVEAKLTGTSTTGTGAAPNGRYWYIGTPMNNTVGGQFFDIQNMVRLWNYNAGNNSWGVVVHSTSNPTVTTTQKLVPGIGYLYRAGANKTITYVGNSGTLNNNIVSNLLAPASDASYVSVTSYNTVGYKYVANPYPSYIDWPSVTRSGLNVSYWLRNATNTAYDAYNATTGQGTSPSGQTTRYIAPMQGFWVYAYTASPAPSLRIDNTDRVHSTNVLHAPTVSQVVRLKLNDGMSSDYAVVYENELAANDYEETDTDKMFDYDFHQLYTMEGEHELSLNGLLNATAKGSVNMGMVVPNNGAYTIEATDLGVEEDVILEDTFNHTFQDLKVNPIYSFTTNAGTFNERFVLHFTSTETVGVGETESVADAVRVFNTSNKQVKVWVSNATSEYQGATVKVYDAIGNLVERKNMTSNELYLDLDIANGIYVVEVTGKTDVFTKKVYVTK